MIKTNFKYTCFSPKKTKSNKPMFSLMDYDKSKPNESKKYCTVFVVNDVELYDRCKIIIKEIQSISLGEYMGKLQVSMFAVIELDNTDVDNSLKNMAGSTTVVNDDSLPF